MEWYGFTNDEVFGSIMENKKYENCNFKLNTLFDLIDAI